MEQPPLAANPRRRRFPPAIRIALLGVAAYLAYKYVDFRELGQALAGLPPVTIAVLFAVVTTDRFMMAFKWRYIGASLGVRLPYWECLKAYYCSSLLAAFMPTSLGGDLYRGFRLAPSAGAAAPIFVSIMMEKVVNAVASLIWGWLGLAYLIGRVPAGLRWALIANLSLLTVAVALVIASLLSRGILERVLRWVRRFNLKRDTSLIEHACAGFSRNPGRLAKAVAFGFVENVGEYVVVFYAGVAMGVDVPPVAFLAAITLNHIVRKVVLYAESWSFAEAATIAAYSLIGIPPHQSLAISLLKHAINMISVLPGTLIFLRQGAPARGESVT